MSSHRSAPIPGQQVHSNKNNAQLLEHPRLEKCSSKVFTATITTWCCRLSQSIDCLFVRLPSADVRDIDGKRRDGVVASILASAKSIANKRKVRIETQMINQDPPATCDDRIQAATAAAAKELNLSTKKMVSRAYHDSLFMARIAPTGMIFIPCKGGYSHRPDEFSSEKDIGNGVGVLALTMAQLSEGTWGDAADAGDVGRDEL